jgi:hypothetical protein
MTEKNSSITPISHSAPLIEASQRSIAPVQSRPIGIKHLADQANTLHALPAVKSVKPRKVSKAWDGKIKTGELIAGKKSIFNVPATGGYVGGCNTGEAMATALLKELRGSESEMAFMRMAGMISTLTRRLEAEGGAAMEAQRVGNWSDSYSTIRGQYVGFTHALGHWLLAASKQLGKNLDAISDESLLAKANAGLNFDEKAWCETFDRDGVTA